MKRLRKSITDLRLYNNEFEEQYCRRKKGRLKEPEMFNPEKSKLRVDIVVHFKCLKECHTEDCQVLFPFVSDCKI